MNFREAIQCAIEFDNHKLNSISDATGIPSPTLSRFITDKRGMQFDFFEKLCEFLQLHLHREIASFDDYCSERWENGGREETIEELEQLKDQQWEEYIEENWEPDEAQFEELALERWKEYAREEWPAYAESEDLDVTDGEESGHWKESVYDEWLEELRSEWEEQAKEEWMEEEYDQWSNDFDDKLEDDNFLYEFFCNQLKELISEESWIIVKG